MTNTHINIGGHKITTNKVGSVHNITNKIQSGFTVNSASYVITNGICTVTCIRLAATATATNKLMLVDLPKAKNTVYFVCPSDFGVANLFGHIGTNETNVIVNINNTSNGYLTFSYPVADDWVES